MSSNELLQDECITTPTGAIGFNPSGKYSSLAKVSLALSVGAAGLLLSDHQRVQAVEAATLENSQADRPISQGEMFMIPAPVTLATAPEAQPVVESSQLVAAVSPSSTSTNRVEPELPAIKHVVAADETFWSLAQRYGVSAEAIAKLNNLAIDATLSLGQSIKIPTTFDRPVAATPQVMKRPTVAPKVATLEPSKRIIAPATDLQVQEDEAIATLRAKQESLAEEIEQLRDQKTEVVFDAEDPKQAQPETLISSTAIQEISPTVVAEDAVVIPVPLPQQPKGRREEDVTAPTLETLVANRTISSDSLLPEPPSLEPEAPVEATPAPQVSSDTSVTFQTSMPESNTYVLEEAVTTRSFKPESTVIATASLGKTHVVRSGETLYAIARRYGLPGHELIAANRLENPNVIKVNQKLVIPTRRADESNNFVALLPSTETTQSINRNSRTLANAPTLGTAETPDSRNNGGELAFRLDVTAESAVNELRADIARMRQNYQEQLAAESPKVQASVEFALNGNSRASETVVNPEWQGEVNEVKPVVESVAVDEPQQLAAASQTDIANYNSLLRLSVGETVSPQLPPLANPDEYLPGEEAFNGYIWPAQGVLTSGYGRRWGRMHRGIDIAAPVGTPIFAAAGGEVVSAGWNSGGYGNLVKVKHKDNSVTLYAHNSRILVRKGQKVKQGQQIAAMGSTGFSTGPHLHFEVHKAGQGAKNPIAFLPKR
ncbi:peptidoglycan DD-metalloendopeptidase family protein [[Limnothrix rosea] IAM M-220]|uniref:peptidoglycan DD-metalloendopeptidase family protein n=1 Tax=[Limnothrix rosea] IAM M-220 TaxID=454133 RepID=UPI000A045BFB